MARRNRKGGVAKPRPWTPMREVTADPGFVAMHQYVAGEGPLEVWCNDIYEVSVFSYMDGWRHLSIKRLDRHAIHDWRHFQAIKNEVCGPETEAVEIYPRESRLVDNANQYHLWVCIEPEGIPIGFTGKLVSDDDVIEQFNEGRRRGRHRGRQRPFQPGLPIAEDRTENVAAMARTVVPDFDPAA